MKHWTWVLIIAASGSSLACGSDDKKPGSNSGTAGSGGGSGGSSTSASGGSNSASSGGSTGSSNGSTRGSNSSTAGSGGSTNGSGGSSGETGTGGSGGETTTGAGGADGSVGGTGGAGGDTSVGAAGASGLDAEVIEQACVDLAQHFDDVGQCLSGGSTVQSFTTACVAVSTMLTLAPGCEPLLVEYHDCLIDIETYASGFQTCLRDPACATEREAWLTCTG